MNTGESGESCNDQGNKQTTRESDQETVKAGTEAKVFPASVCIILRSK